MASIRVDYTIFYEEDYREKKGKLFVPVDMDCDQQELIDCVHDAILDTCEDDDDVIGGSAVIYYFGTKIDVQFQVEENEECQTTIH
tara:strand:- start:1628 stop:1885 length:258 start_codon:yes stop_codon:yes gene_type:complete